MPKTEIDYSNTIIYKITCKDQSVTDVYVGHTTNFVQRKFAHKQNCINNKIQSLLYTTIRENGKWDNWTMEIVDVVNCANHYDAVKKTQEYSILLHANLNNSSVHTENIQSTLFCKTCNLALKTEFMLKNHCKTQKHLIMVKKLGLFTETVPEFSCEKCLYSSSNKKDYAKHIATKKHKMLINANNANEFVPKIPNLKDSHAADNLCSCGKKYKHVTSLYRHKQNCNIPSTDESIIISPSIKSLTDLVLDVVKQNQELTKQIVELSAKHITNNNNTIISNNNCNNTNKFNLNVFLNEKCKDAMNIGDFVNSLQLQIKDLENVGEYGFAEGISRIFTRGLKELDVYKRPIHCSDLKREILHMKSEGQWEKTNCESPKLIKAIKQVANKNISMLAEWRKENPGCEKYNSRKNDTYLKLTMESMGPTEEKETERDFGKIIRSIAKDTIIEKDGQMLL